MSNAATALPLSSATAAWADAVRSQAERLRSLYAPLETLFLEIGDELKKTHSTLRELTELATQLSVRLAAEDFQRTLTDLDRALDAVAGIRRRKVDCSDSLSAILGTATGIRKTLGRLQEVMSHVSILGINVRIEAGQLGSGGDFLSFTDEIVRLSKRGGKTLGDALSVLATLTAASAEANDQQKEFERTHLRHLDNIGEHFGESVKVMRERERAAARAMDDLRALLGVASDRVGDIVSGLQAGDIVRQRIEHVEQALDLLERKLRDGPEGGGGEAIEDMAIDVFLAATCSLEAEHIDGIKSEFGGRVAQVFEGLTALTGIINAIRDDSDAVYRAGVDGDSCFLQKIGQDLEMVARVVTEYGEVMRRAGESLAAVEDGAFDMASAMTAIRDIDTDMSILGLNASIKCDRLGSRGRALNVIAQELRSYARETRSLTHVVSERLDDMVRHANGLTQVSKGTGANDDLATLKVSLDGWIKTLEESGEETADILSDIRTLSVTVVTRVEQAMGRFDIHRQIEASLEAATSALRQLISRAAPRLAEGELAEARTRLLGFLEERYTMESERAIHGGAAPAAPPPNTAADLSDVLF